MDDVLLAITQALFYVHGGSDAVVEYQNPYAIVKRNGDYCVVKADTGELVPGGNHGPGEKGRTAAGKHLAALERNVKE